MFLTKDPAVWRILALAALTGVLISQARQTEAQTGAPRGVAVNALHTGASTVTAQPDEFGGVASTCIFVKLKADAHQRMRMANQDSDPRNRLGERFQATADTWRVAKMTPLYAGPFADSVLAARYGLDRMYVIDVPRGTDTETMAAAFAALDEEVESAGYDSIGGVALEEAPGSIVTGGTLTPDDTSFAWQWALDNTGQTIGGQAGTPDADIDAPEAWSTHSGILGTVTVAILSSGLSAHADIPIGRILPGYNTVLDSDDPADLADTCPFGTQVAGVIGATGNNGLGIAGVTWGANLLPVRVLTGCFGNVTDVIEGILWAADHGANVIDMSLQYPTPSPAIVAALQSAVDYARDRGAVLVAAVGQTTLSCGGVCYPARSEGVIGVSGTDSNDAFDSASRYGPQTDLAAPGKNIYSTRPLASYGFQSGTGMASAHVSGLAALIKSYAPFRTNDQIADILQQSADDLGDPGWDDHFGYGRINAANAIIAAIACADAADCDDRNPCTDDACPAGVCEFSNNSAACDDALFCTVGDTCSDGGCIGSPMVCPNDTVPCTHAACDEANDQCVQVPNHAACADGVFCNGVERCDVATGCRPALRVPCPANLCDEARDRCRIRPNAALHGSSGPK